MVPPSEVPQHGLAYGLWPRRLRQQRHRWRNRGRELGDDKITIVHRTLRIGSEEPGRETSRVVRAPGQVRARLIRSVVYRLWAQPSPGFLYDNIFPSLLPLLSSCKEREFQLIGLTEASCSEFRSASLRPDTLGAAG